MSCHQTRCFRHYLNRAVGIGCLGLMAAMLIAGCAADPGPPILYPKAGAPVTVALDSETLLVTNHSSRPIYYTIFPTEILPLIEWAPCWHPDQCPDETPIPPDGERQLPLSGIIEKKTESVTFFWWTIPDNQAELPFMVEEFQVLLP